MSDDYCFRRAVKGQLSQCKRRNTATVLRTVVKSHKGLKGTKVFACACSGRNLKNFSNFTGKTPCWSNVVALETLTQKVKLKVAQSTLSKKRRLYRDSYTSTFL